MCAYVYMYMYVLYTCTYMSITYTCKKGFLGGSGSKKIYLKWRKPGFNPWVVECPWRREWKPTPVFLPGEFHGQRSLVGYIPWLTKSWAQHWLTLSLFLHIYTLHMCVHMCMCVCGCVCLCVCVYIYIYIALKLFLPIRS